MNIKIPIISCFVLMAFSCDHPEQKTDKKSSEQKQVFLSEHQMDSLSAVIKASSLKNDIKKIDEIYNTYLKVIWKDTVNADFYLQRAHTNLMKFQFENSLKDIARAQKIKPDFANVYYVKGLVYGMALPQSDSDIFYFSKAIHLDTKNTLYLETRSEIYNERHNYQKALVDIEQAIKIEPENVQLLALKATYLHNSKDFENAISIFNKIIPKLKRDDLIYTRGSCYYHLGKNDLAMQDFNEAIKLNPNIGYYYTYRAGIKFKLKDRDGACEDFKRASDLGDPEGTKYYNDCLEWYSKHKKA